MHLNRFGPILYKDTDTNNCFASRILAFENIEQNPLECYLKSKQRDWQRNKIIGLVNICAYFRNHPKLLRLRLRVEDVEAFIGRPFQLRLAAHYCLRMDGALTLRIRVDNDLFFEFDKMNSKFTASKTRKVLIDFKPQLDFLESDRSESKSSELNRASGSIGVPNLERILICGDCKSGLRMVMPCAHGAAILTLIYHSIHGTLNVYLRESPNRMRIKSSIIDVRAAKEWIIDSNHTLYCLCQKVFDPEVFMMLCCSCNDWFHPRCVGLRIAQMDISDLEGWVCPECVEKFGIR